MKELFIRKQENITQILLIEDYELVEKYEEKEEEKSLEGNIYIGKVQNILPGLQSAFVDIGEKKNAFIHIKDILPKINILENEVEEVPIGKVIKTGDPIIVEVKRDSVEHKGAKVSTHINLAGRFIVLLPNTPFITVSQKIEDENEKQRLKNIVKELLPENCGAIVRTSAKNLNKTDIEDDIKNCIEKWNSIQKKKVTTYPQKIYSNGGILKKIILDLVDLNLDKIIVGNENLRKTVENILEEINANVEIEINKDYIKKYDLEKQLKIADNRKIWLKCGGFITIDKTEALTAIDVNSGKFVGKKDSEETVTKVNIEAAHEIAKRLRLMDISGIVIIDFIDMKTDNDKEIVIQELLKSSKKDRSKIQIEEFTKLNLMELTRKHISGKKK